MMKLVVSTKGLALIVKQAIDMGITQFDVDGQSERVYFKNDIQSISVGGGTTQTYKKGLYKGVFLKEQWIKILSFISLLEEQPVVMEFTEYMHTDVHEHPEITLSEFVKRFK